MAPNREPMWYCHQCGAEMHPLMVPDPRCASCNGTFVEMIESTQDDPRTFLNGGDFDDFPGPFPPQMRDLFPGPRPGGGGFSLSMNRSSSPGGSTRTFVLGGPRQADVAPDRVMPLTEFLAEHGRDGGGRPMRDGPAPGGIPPQHLMINQILGMLAQRYTDQRGAGAPNPFADILGMHELRGGPEGGGLGDYALNQQALDQIMTALMENSNANRPVPATEEALDKLDHQVLEEGSPLLEKDCAVCKDQFSLNTEDPDEQVVITLPCQHPFHSPCILPWLKQNGTCPSCRYQLVPQPGTTQNPNETPGPGPSTATANLPRSTASRNHFAQPRTETSSSRWSVPSRDRDRGAPPDGGDGGGGGFLGMVGNLLHSLSGGHPSPGPAPSSSGSGSGSVPGGWEGNHSPRPEPGNWSSFLANHPTQSNHGTYSNPAPTRSSPSHYDRLGSTFGSSREPGSNNRDRSGDSTPDRASHAFGRHRRNERDRNRDRNGQRRNHNPWDNPELD